MKGQEEGLVKNESALMFEGRGGKPISIGSRVSFEVENSEDWMGGRTGTLFYEDGEFKIATTDDVGMVRVLTIDKGYDAYSGTVEQI